MLDKNILTNELINNLDNRDDLCITEDVLDEAGFSEFEISRIKKAGIQIIQLSQKHLEKLKEVMATHGDNLKLINLYNAKGTADVAMIAYITAERENPETLFADEYSIVTKDTELTKCASSYGINCTFQVPK